MNEISDTRSEEKYTEEEKEKIEELRERVLDMLQPENNKDQYLIKWLRARQFDLDKAEEMLKKHIRYMKTSGLDQIAENYVPIEATKYFHTATLGYDNEGSVVRILHVGGSDLKGMCLSVSKLDSTRFAAYILLKDSLKQKKDRANSAICEKQVYILDLKDLSWMAVIDRNVMNHTFMLLKFYENNYPECLKVVYVVNVPYFFSFIYNWLKVILPESIISKMQVISGEDSREALTKHIDPSILPPSLGGTRADPNGSHDCESLYEVPLKVTVPESLMLYNQLHVLSNDPTASRTVVENGSSFTVGNVITEPNSSLQWDFQTVDYDIGMGLNYKVDKDSDPKVIIPIHRIDCNKVPESGNFTCEQPGTYEIIFDNTYSWLTSKELIYKVDVLPPREYDIN